MKLERIDKTHEVLIPESDSERDSLKQSLGAGEIHFFEVSDEVWNSYPWNKS